MKKRTLYTIFVFAVLLFILGLTGCPDPDATPPGPGDVEVAAQLVEEATQLMKDGDWEGAMGKFAQAILKDPANGNAQIGYAFLNVASIAVDPQMVELAGNRLKFNNYPTSMNDFYSEAWYTKPVQEYDLEMVLYPEITVPAEIAVWEDGDASVITTGEYSIAFLYNFVTANPNGLNELVDGVIYDVLGTKLDLAIAAIKSMSSDMTFTITWDMFSDNGTAPTEWPRDAAGNPVNVVIGKDELLIESAGLKFLKSEFEVFTSYKLTLPLTEYWDAFNPLDGLLGGQAPDWGTLTTPFEAEFLFARPEAQAKLDNARLEAASALEDLIAALTGIIADRPGMFLSSTSPNSYLAESWSSGVNELKFVKALFLKMNDSVRNNTTIFIPVTDQGFSDTDEFFIYYGDVNNWPVAADWGSDWINGGSSPQVISLNLGALYAGNILAMNNLLSLQSNGEPELYKFTYTDANYTPYSATAGTLSATPVSGNLSAGDVQESGAMYAFKVRDLTLNGLFVFDSSVITEFRNIVNSLYAIPNIGDQLIVVNGDNSVSLFLPVVPPVFAAEAYGAVSGDSVLVDYGYLPSSGYEHTYYGSFWWALPEFFNYIPVYMKDVVTYSSFPGTENCSIGADFTIYYELILNPANAYKIAMYNATDSINSSVWDSLNQNICFGNINPNAIDGEYILIPSGNAAVFIKAFQFSESNVDFTLSVEALTPSTLTLGTPVTGAAFATGETKYYEISLSNGDYSLMTSTSDGNFVTQAFFSKQYYYSSPYPVNGSASIGSNSNLYLSSANAAIIEVINATGSAATCDIQISYY